MNIPSGFCVAILITLFTFSRQYELGTVYNFDYHTKVLLNDRQGDLAPTAKNVGFQLALLVDVAPVWQNPRDGSEQILELNVRSPKLSVRSRQTSSAGEFVDKPSKVDSVVQAPFFVLRKDGFIEHVFFTDRDDPSWINIKKGIAGHFQYLQKEGVREETDSTGRCLVTYKLTEKKFLQKTFANCSTPDYFPAFSHSQKVLGAEVTRTSDATFELDSNDGSFVRSSAVDIRTMRVEARKSSVLEVTCNQDLVLKRKTESKSKTIEARTSSEAIEYVAKSVQSSLLKEQLLTSVETKGCIACKSLKDLVSNFRKALSSSNLATQSSAIAFLRLLRKMRESDKNTIKAVFKDKKNAKILPQLLDIAAAAQTISAHNGAKESFDFGAKSPELSERYLLGLSLGTHPLEYVIEDLLKMSKKTMRDPKLYETLILSLASMTKTFSSQHKNSNIKIISDVRNKILKDLENCKEEDCVLVHIRALNNLQSESTLAHLIRLAKGPNKKQAISAMRAIQTMPHDYISGDIRKELESILFELDTRHDSSVRAMAAEALLRWPFNVSLLRNLFKHLFSESTSKAKELNTLIWGHIQDLGEKDARVDKLVRSVLSDTNLTNWNILSHGGLSSAFSRPLGVATSLNASFTNMLEINAGLLKRSNVDVFIDVAEDVRMRLLSFGMFAGGLSMFGSEESGEEKEEEAEEASAGIEIALMGSQLRPFVFFTGQGELMGHVWSGTASERTTALQGSVLLHDHSQMVSLLNGLNLEFTLTGVVSYDFAGQVQISLWNRNAHSLVEVSSAVIVQGQARVDSSFVQTMVELNSGAQTQLNFISDLDFSDEITMCLQMVQPNFDLIDTVRKFERIPGNNYVLRKYKKKSCAIPGKTFVMNRKNTELCTKMFKNM